MPDYPVLRTVIARKIIHGDEASRNEGKMMAAELRGILSAFEAAQQKGKTMNDKKIIEVLEMIAKEQVDDAKNFEGAPFTGRTVAEYFGNQGAAIAALANIIKSLVESSPTLHEAKSGGAQVDDQDKPENDRSKACRADHDAFRRMRNCPKWCPECGERLSS